MAEMTKREQELDTLARDHYEESERLLDKITAVRDWYDENQAHEVYLDENGDPEECTDECEWCVLADILNAAPKPHDAATGENDE